MRNTPLLQKSKTKTAYFNPKDSRNMQDSDMIGVPGTAYRKKVDADLKSKQTEVKKQTSPAKMITEKGSYEKGKVEKYASKAAMAKHEKKETKSFERKESAKPSPMKQTFKANKSSEFDRKAERKVTIAKESVGKKTSPTKMKKC
jgi:hypothetical protein